MTLYLQINTESIMHRLTKNHAAKIQIHHSNCFKKVLTQLLSDKIHLKHPAGVGDFAS